MPEMRSANQSMMTNRRCPASLSSDEAGLAVHRGRVCAALPGRILFIILDLEPERGSMKDWPNQSPNRTAEQSAWRRAWIIGRQIVCRRVRVVGGGRLARCWAALKL